jgi:hypothetical protein
MINALAVRSPAAMRAASVDPIFGAIEVTRDMEDAAGELR